MFQPPNHTAFIIINLISMSSNPVLDDDDILLIPADEEPASNDTPTSSSISPGSVYPHWTEDPNRLPTSLNIPATDLEMDIRRAEHSAQLTVIQISGWQSGGPPPSLADPPLSTTGNHNRNCKLEISTAPTKTK